jgi:hypothetical protein
MMPFQLPSSASYQGIALAMPKPPESSAPFIGWKT